MSVLVVADDLTLTPSRRGTGLRRRRRVSTTQRVEQGCAHYAGRGRDSIEELEREFTLVHEHPGAVGRVPAGGEGGLHELGRLPRVNQIVEQTVCRG
jgi:hypothetical protein